MTMTITFVENPNGTYTSTADCQERFCRGLYRNSGCKDWGGKDSEVSRQDKAAEHLLRHFKVGNHGVFQSLTTLILAGVRPNISLPSLPTACTSGAVVENNGRGLVDHDAFTPGTDPLVNSTQSIAKSAENKFTLRKSFLSRATALGYAVLLFRGSRVL